MSAYHDLPSLSELRDSAPFNTLVKIVNRLKQGGLEKNGFRSANEAIVAMQRMKGFVAQGSAENVDALGNPPKDHRLWNLSTTNFFFVKDEKQAADDNRQWVYLVCARIDLRHKFGAVSMRRLPVRMQFEHVRRRLLENSGKALDINSDPIIFMALSGTFMAHLMPLISNAPKNNEGVYPAFLPEPMGLFLGHGKPCDKGDFDYTYGHCVRWIKGEPVTPAPAKTGHLPGLGGALPGIPTKPTVKDVLRPFIQKIPTQDQPTLPDKCVSFDIKPTFYPTVEITINTYIDVRMMKGAQRSLFNQQLFPLITDKEFAAGMSILSSAYMIGKVPIAPSDLKLFERMRYADKLLRGIILGPEWAAQSAYSLRTYAKDNPKDPTPT